MEPGALRGHCWRTGLSALLKPQSDETAVSVSVELRLLQYNVLSLKAPGAADLLAQGLRRYCVDLAGLQETRQRHTGITTQDGFWVLHAHSARHWRRTALDTSVSALGQTGLHNRPSRASASCCSGILPRSPATHGLRTCAAGHSAGGCPPCLVDTPSNRAASNPCYLRAFDVCRRQRYLPPNAVRAGYYTVPAGLLQCPELTAIRGQPRPGTESAVPP